MKDMDGMKEVFESMGINVSEGVEAAREELKRDDAVEEEKKAAGTVNVGKALSETHKRKMIKHECIVPVMTKVQRLMAVGSVIDFP